MRHCDEYIDDTTQPECLRTWLSWARSPAHGMNAEPPHPACYADYHGGRVRLVMASRFGDVGITADLERSIGYSQRVSLADLSNFGALP